MTNHSNSPTRSEWENLFEPATQSASTAMQSWTNGAVALTLGDVQELPLEEVSSALQLGDALSIMVVIDLTGNYGGQIILQFDEDGARQVVGCLLGRTPNPLDAWGKLEVSALAETGNILASAYLNRITQIGSLRVMPSPPRVVQDFAASVLESAIMTQAIACENVLLCRTQFHLRGEPVEWNVFFVPSLELLTALRNHLP